VLPDSIADSIAHDYRHSQPDLECFIHQESNPNQIGHQHTESHYECFTLCDENPIAVNVASGTNH
jgi:hypothetical protein